MTDAAADVMLQATDVHYHAGGAHILRGIDLTIAAGDIVSLVGPNGAGKSTLLKCLNGVLRPSRGDVRVAGRPAASFAARDLARLIAYVPQHDSATISLSVADMVGLGRAPHRGTVSRSHDRAVVLDAMQHLGLEPFALRPFSSLSGGERQRVLIARALAQEGRILLLDEPTTALDLRHQLETMTIVRGLAQDRRLSVLIAIHDLGLASRFSDRLVMLAEGRVHAEGRWQDVLRSEHVEHVYGVDVVVGTHGELPYVIPTASRARQNR